MYETVREYEIVRKEHQQDGTEAHFGNLLRLCHVKHSELEAIFHRYKGRVVFRGDDVEDQTTDQAVFSEQGTSASHLCAAKIVDAISRMPGCDGGDSDATGAYTQALHRGTKTYVFIPRDKWPKSWHNMGLVRPVVELRLNLYGHPLAGLFWEQHCHEAMKQLGNVYSPQFKDGNASSFTRRSNSCCPST